MQTNERMDERILLLFLRLRAATDQRWTVQKVANPLLRLRSSLTPQTPTDVEIDHAKTEE